MLVLTQIGACAGPGYYAQAISGHLQLMRSRVDIADVLQDAGTDPVLAERLRLTETMRRFAHEQLGLPDSDTYGQLAVTGRKAVTWNVVAAPEFSLQPELWCFPVAGCVPYRGYFALADAEKFAGSLRRKGLDVSVSPAVAYSSLGWFDDPLLDTMLQYSDAALAGIMFHELAHELLYVKGDTTFNESFAGFVESAGLERWLQERSDDQQLQYWTRLALAKQEFAGLVRETRRDLQTVYASGLPESAMRQAKQEVFNSLETAYRQMVETDWQGADYFAGWMAGELNNAQLTLMESYEGGMCAFAALYRDAGQDFEPFYRLVKAKAALGTDERNEWLARDCSHVDEGTDDRVGDRVDERGGGRDPGVGAGSAD